MDKITGNFLTQGNRDFPLDCEGLEAMQTNTVLTGLLGNIGGDRIILAGCEPSADGSSRGEGYVFVRTQAFPGGEVLRFEGGPVAGGMYVRQEDIAVSAQGYEYPKAYTRRTLSPGVGAENFSWDDFTAITSTRDLLDAIAGLRDELRAEVARFAPAPLGIVQMWSGVEIPDGYGLCNGQELKVSDYPELYRAIGTAFNSAFSAGGTKYNTSEGRFRLPDLRGRFIVGYHDSDNDYMEAGRAGGEKQHTLTVDEMPEHAHSFKDYYYPENIKRSQTEYDLVGVNNNVGSADTDYDNNALHYYRHDTDKAGKNAAHENRPPYYVLAYVMRLK